MRTRVNSLLPAALMLLAFGNPTAATWTEPVPVPQVNAEYGDRTPFLSYDGLTLYFSRVDTPQFYYHRIYQATREDASAPFTEVTEISSLNYSGGHVPCPWVSSDNLRLYHHRTEPGSRHRLKVSKRESTDEAWPAGDNISELNILGNLNDPSLTQDELTIVFMGYNLPGGRGQYDLYTATRPDLNSPFGNVVNLTQLNTPASDADPFISPDGRSLHFTSNINGYYQIYKATRESLNLLEQLSICLSSIRTGQIQDLLRFPVMGVRSIFAGNLRARLSRQIFMYRIFPTSPRLRPTTSMRSTAMI
ncbi:MAG: TolB family protein [Planctomycetota bacterium]